MGKENTKQKTGNAVLNALKKSNMTAMAAILVIMIIIASVVSPHFLNIYNLQSVLRDLAFIGMIGIAQSLLLLVGELDLSVGKIACLCGILSGMLMVNAGVNPWLSLLVGMILGVVFGFINGIIITRLRLNSMVATIGMQGVYGGVNLVITKGKAVTGIPDDVQFLGKNSIGPVPIPFVICLIVLIIILFMVKKTKTGRYIYAIGNSMEAAKILGIKVDRIRVMIYSMRRTDLLLGRSSLCMPSGFRADSHRRGLADELYRSVCYRRSFPDRWCGESGRGPDRCGSDHDHPEYHRSVWR